MKQFYTSLTFLLITFIRLNAIDFEKLQSSAKNITSINKHQVLSLGLGVLGITLIGKGVKNVYNKFKWMPGPIILFEFHMNLGDACFIMGGFASLYGCYKSYR